MLPKQCLLRQTKIGMVGLHMKSTLNWLENISFNPKKILRILNLNPNRSPIIE